jgi:hypothetical protein
MRPNEYVVVLAEAFLGVFILLPWTDALERATALGAMVGVVGGHLNGRRADKG